MSLLRAESLTLKKPHKRQFIRKKAPLPAHLKQPQRIIPVGEALRMVDWMCIDFKRLLGEERHERIDSDSQRH